MTGPEVQETASPSGAPMGGWVPEWAIRPKSDGLVEEDFPGFTTPATPVVEIPAVEVPVAEALPEVAPVIEEPVLDAVDAAAAEAPVIADVIEEVIAVAITPEEEPLPEGAEPVGDVTPVVEAIADLADRYSVESDEAVEIPLPSEVGEVLPEGVTDEAIIEFADEVTAEAIIEFADEVTAAQQAEEVAASEEVTLPVVTEPTVEPVTATPAQETVQEEEEVPESAAVALPAAPPSLPLTRPLSPTSSKEVFREGDGDGASRGMTGIASRLPLSPATPGGEAPVATPKALVPEIEEDDVWEEPTPEGNPDDEFPSDDPEGAADKAAKENAKKKAYGVKVTDRDVALLQFLTRYRYATYPQIAGYLGTSVNALRQRFPRLAKAGLIVGDNAGQAKFLAWRPTETGVLLSELDLPTPTLSWATAAHTLGLVDIGIRFEAAGETVVTEREIRAADTRERPTERMLRAKAFQGGTSTDVDTFGDDKQMFVVSLGAGEGQFQHIPDMCLVRPPAEDGTSQNVAIELELRRKPPTQWRKILRAYRDSPVYAYVVYFCHRKDIRDGIQKAAIELGMTHMIEVRKFTPADSTLPLPEK